MVWRTREFVGGGQRLGVDVFAPGLGLELGVGLDRGRAGGVDRGDLGGGAFVGVRVDDARELGEREIVHLADLDGGVGGVEQIVHELGGEFGLGVGLHVFPLVFDGA